MSLSSETTREFTVPEESTGERLDRFLAEHVEDLSRSRIQKLIEDGNVLVDGKSAKAKQSVKVGERVVLTVPPATEGPMKAEDIPLDLLFEDEQILVLNKPAGLVVHPAPGNLDGTLVNAILHHAPDLRGVGGVKRPGLVQRLDKDTSGVMVVAKTDKAYHTLVEAMSVRAIKRTYLAVCRGFFEEDEGLIEAPIGRHPSDRKKMAVVPAGKHAVTHFRVKERFKETCLLKVDLETGRTHQIRVHLAHVDHPVVGDSVYGGRSAAREGIDRQALHAWRLKFEHPVTGKALVFEAPIPEEIERLITALRSK